MVRPQLPPEEQIGRNPEYEEYNNKGNYVDSVIRVLHVQLLQRRLRRLKVAVFRGARELWPVEAVSCEGCALETVSDVRKIRDPPEVDGNGVEGDEEAGEEQERH